MKKMVKSFLLHLVIWVNICIFAHAHDELVDFTKFDQYVAQSMQDWSVPGAAIAIVKGGKVIYLKTYGVRNVTTQQPVTPETLFPIASLTKGFTVALIARLVEEGKIQWEDRVQKYLPDFKIADEAASSDFTIEDLFSQRSGLPGFAADSLVETGWRAEEIYHALPKIPLKDPFRSTYNYQNVFPGIGGWIAEKVTHKPLSALYEDYLFSPLHLESAIIGKDGLTGGESFFTWMRKKIKAYFAPNVTQYCQLKGQALEVEGGNDSLYCFEASRGITMSITDMAKWAIFHLNKGIEDGQVLLSKTNIERMRTPHIHIGTPQGGRLFPKERVKSIDYGMGWFIHDYDRLQVLSHMGGMTGVRSLIVLLPHEEVGIVILSNMGGMRVSLFPEAIRSKFLDLYLKLPDQPDWSRLLRNEVQAATDKIKEQRNAFRLQHPVKEGQERSYIGTYENDLYGVLNIIQEKGQLFLLYRDLKVELAHWNGDIFNFPPHRFSKAYPAIDIGEVSFLDEGGPKGVASLLEINLLREGKDKPFYRKK